MTTVTLTRPDLSRPASLAAILDGLARHLHASHREMTLTHRDGSLVVAFRIAAPIDKVRIACAAVVHEPVTWAVTP